MIKKYNFALNLSFFVFCLATIIFYFLSKNTGGIGTAPLVFSGDDGLMYHNVASGLENTDGDFFCVDVIRFLYSTFYPDQIVVRIFLIFVFLTWLCFSTFVD